MSARSSGESACVTRAVGPRQSSGNSAVARLKKEYDSVKRVGRPPASGAGDESAAEARGGGHRAPRRRRAEARRAEGTRRTRGGTRGEARARPDVDARRGATRGARRARPTSRGAGVATAATNARGRTTGTDPAPPAGRVSLSFGQRRDSEAVRPSPAPFPSVSSPRRRTVARSSALRARSASPPPTSTARAPAARIEPPPRPPRPRPARLAALVPTAVVLGAFGVAFSAAPGRRPPSSSWVRFSAASCARAAAAAPWA